ncbi:MAG: glutamine synthetase [Rickettsiaceae bacterium]|nr:glutamine synthetase [Rickettsiaceae bacterium]
MNNDNKLTDIQEQYNLLSKLEQQFREELKLTPCIGAEIEFYIHGNVNIDLLAQKIGYTIKEEKGQNQYEVDLLPSKNIALYAQEISELRSLIIKSTIALGARADFSSKPFANDYGSSMHIHLNFVEDSDVEKYARILCHYVLEDISVFLPSKDDYLRLDSKFMAPTHISYGGNNRTVLIRIPDSKPKRLEHRLAAANAEPAAVICSILQSINKGIVNFDKIRTLAKTFGNASDAQYALQKIQY